MFTAVKMEESGGNMKDKRKLDSGEEECTNRAAQSKRFLTEENSIASSSSSTLEAVETPQDYTTLTVVSRLEIDRTHLLNLLPEEVWLKVFENVEPFNYQLENVANSSLFFRKLLLPHRQNSLFPTVWRILSSRDEKNTMGLNVDDCLWDMERHDHQIDLREILKLRLVSRSWCDAIDNFYQNHTDNFKVHAETMYSRQERPVFRQLRLEVPRKVGSFLAHFLESHGFSDRNPLFGRNLVLHFHGWTNDELGKTRQRRLRNALQKFGHHVWYCDFDYNILFTPCPSMTTLYKRIREALCLMPNLKVLNMIHLLPPSSEEPIPDLAEFMAEVNANPLPTLKHLKIFRCRMIYEPLYQEFIRRNQQLVALEISWQRTSPPDCVFMLPHLKTLAATTIGIESEFRTDSQLSSPVTELYLSCYSFSDPIVHLQTLYDLVGNRYKNTLTFLHLSINLKQGETDRARVFKKGDSYKLDLPNLTHLKLLLVEVVCLDFLLPMKNTLTTMDLIVEIENGRKWSQEYAEMVESGACIKFFARVRRLLEPNIFQIFSKLKIFTFKYSDEAETFTWSFSRQ